MLDLKKQQNNFKDFGTQFDGSLSAVIYKLDSEVFNAWLFKVPSSRGLTAGTSDGARFLDTAHKTRYVEIFESQALKTSESSI